MGNPFITNLENYVTLSGADRAAIEALTNKRVSFTPGMELVAHEDSPRACHILLEGQAFRHRNLADGRRQILCFIAPGDMLDLQGLFLDLDYDVSALSKGQVAVVHREEMEALLGSRPQVALGLWRLTLVEAAIFREWMVGMGRRSAHARIAHLLCEVYVRMQAVGMAQNGRCPFPRHPDAPWRFAGAVGRAHQSGAPDAARGGRCRCCTRGAGGAGLDRA